MTRRGILCESNRLKLASRVDAPLAPDEYEPTQRFTASLAAVEAFVPFQPHMKGSADELFVIARCCSSLTGLHLRQTPSVRSNGYASLMCALSIS